MADIGIDILVDHQWNDGDPAGMGGVDDVPPRVASDGAVGIGVVPRGTQDIDLVQVCEERRAAVIGVDVVHLDHPAWQYAGQRRWHGEFGTGARPAPRTIGGLDTRVDRDASPVR